MAKISREDVLSLANLAKLKLTEKEIEKYQQELSEILNYVEKLNEVDVTGLKPTTQVTGLKGVTRKDIVVDYGISTQELLKNAPSKLGNNLKVRRVL